MNRKNGKKGAPKLADDSTKINRSITILSSDSQRIGKKTRLEAIKQSSSTSESIKPVHSSDNELLSSGIYHWGEEEYEESSKLKVTISRTSMLLLDYREFKAARTIQTALRGWYTRHMLAKKIRSASIIQRAWRFFLSQGRYYRKLEETLQTRIIEHFNRMATKIQALWRGYWVRENIHDHYRLKRMQIRAAEDLLHCVAFKLHHLLRTHQIPGVYSLRNSNCLSKVEKLLASMTYKVHNEKVRVARTRREQAIQVAIYKHGQSEFNSNIPYSGPDFGICEPKCCALYKEDDADKKMFKILSLYEKAIQTGSHHKRARTPRGKAPKSRIKKKPKPPGDFCTDIVKSMQRWDILGKNNVSVNPDVFKKPENVERFLIEIESLTSLLKSRCHCYLKPNEYEIDA